MEAVLAARPDGRARQLYSAEIPTRQPYYTDAPSLTLLDIERLEEIAGFNQDYLHLGGAPPEARRYIDVREHNCRKLC